MVSQTISFLYILAMVVFALATNELFAYESSASVNYSQPILSIWHNHQWIVLNVLVSYKLYSIRTNTPFLKLIRTLTPIRESLELAKWSPAQAVKIYISLAFLFMVPNVCWVISIQSGLSITINNSIAQSSVVFVYLLSILFLGAKFKYTHLIAVFISLGGVVMIAISLAQQATSTDSSTTFGGILACLLVPIGSSVFAIYFKTCSRHWVSDVERSCMMMGLMGSANLTVLPVILLLGIAGLEDVVWPSNSLQLEIFLLIAVAALLYNWSYMGAINATTPLWAALGNVLGIPASVLYDYFISHTFNFDLLSGTGTILVIICFIYFSHALEKERKLAERQNQHLVALAASFSDDPTGMTSTEQYRLVDADEDSDISNMSLSLSLNAENNSYVI